MEMYNQAASLLGSFFLYSMFYSFLVWFFGVWCLLHLYVSLNVSLFFWQQHRLRFRFSWGLFLLINCFEQCKRWRVWALASGSLDLLAVWCFWVCVFCVLVFYSPQRYTAAIPAAASLLGVLRGFLVSRRTQKKGGKFFGSLLFSALFFPFFQAFSTTLGKTQTTILRLLLGIMSWRSLFQNPSKLPSFFFYLCVLFSLLVQEYFFQSGGEKHDCHLFPSSFSFFFPSPLSEICSQPECCF